MHPLALKEPPVAKKKVESAVPKKYGTLIRVSDEFANAIRRASSFEKVSIADFASTHLMATVEKRYRDAVMREARRMERGAEQ